MVFFYRQAEYLVILNSDKLNEEDKEFIVKYMGDCSTEKHLHKKIEEFQYITLRQKAFALVFSIH